MTASIVLGIIIAISAFVTITLCTRNIHGKATFAALITATLSIEQIIVYIPPDSIWVMLFGTSAIFFILQTVIEFRQYLKEYPKSYDRWKDIPMGVSYVQNLDGTYSTITKDEAKKLITNNKSVHTNIIFKQTTHNFASEADKQEYLKKHNMNKYPRLNETTVNAICNMFRSSEHTHGYDPDSPIGRIAQVAYTNWHCRGQKYPEWHLAEYEQPTKTDITEKGEILVLATDGTYHICDPDNKITRDDGTVEWFNGDVFVEPYLWMAIPIAIKKWNVTAFPNIPKDPKTNDRKFF